jgi:hypothetical protein
MNEDYAKTVLKNFENEPYNRKKKEPRTPNERVCEMTGR